MFKVNNRNTRTRCEICSKLIIGVVLVSLLLTLNIFLTLLGAFIVNFEQANVSGLFQAAIVGNTIHREILECHKQDLNLHIVGVQTVLNEVV